MDGHGCRCNTVILLACPPHASSQSIPPSHVLTAPPPPNAAADIDAAEISKNKTAHVPVCGDVKQALSHLNRLLAAEPLPADKWAGWRAELAAKRAEFPMRYPQRDDAIVPQHAIQVLGEETQGEAIITTGVGQHQMWAAQWYPYKETRRWISSGGLGSMGFGLPAALGAAVAFDGKNGRPKKTVVDIDGDGSFLMNVQVRARVTSRGGQGLNPCCWVGQTW